MEIKLSVPRVFTAIEKRRLSRSPMCPECGKKIEYDDNVVVFKKNEGRCIKYDFYHLKCIKFEGSVKKWDYLVH